MLFEEVDDLRYVHFISENASNSLLVMERWLWYLSENVLNYNFNSRFVYW